MNNTVYTVLYMCVCVFCSVLRDLKIVKTTTEGECLCTIAVLPW